MEQDRSRTPDPGTHDPEMTEPDEANAPDTDPTDDRELAGDIDDEGPRSPSPS